MRVGLLIVLTLGAAFTTTPCVAQSPTAPVVPIPADDSSAGGRSGGWRLAHEESDYLAEHAKNPVEWYAWGEEAFQKAKQLDRPIFLSIGYSSCHWCHVMRRESFSDVEIAQYMNEHFINIKVDREELPHVDALYMDAVQRMNIRGGWPLSVWLTPDRVPFIGGTYFPPRPKFGRPGFLELLQLVQEKWTDEREMVVAQGQSILDRVVQAQKARGAAPQREEFLRRGRASFQQRYDSVHGGFGGAPKFPSPRAVTLLATIAVIDGDAAARNMAIHTLEQWAQGGLNDQVGGGFHRYSVDAEWKVPHFEKMLYNQGLNAEAYLDVARLTESPQLAEEARRTLDALCRDFGLDSGALASSWDADSEEEEGTFYLWTPQQVSEVLGERAPLLCAYLEITPEGNFEGSPRTVPQRALSLEQLQSKFPTLPVATLRRQVEQGLVQLHTARSQRVHPHRDEKVLLGWNALAVSALAKGSVQLGSPHYLMAARNAHAFCMQHLVTETGFSRRFADGEVEHPATLEDAAYFLKGTLDLYEASLDPTHIAVAKKLFERILQQYGPDTRADAAASNNSGGFYEVSPGNEILGPRPKRFWSGAVPSANATLARALLRLHALTGNANYRQHAEGILDEALTVLGEQPTASPETMLAVLELTQPMAEIAIVGDIRNPLTHALLEVARRGPFPSRVVAHRPLGIAGDKAAQAIALLADRALVENRSSAYLCVDFTCQAPTTDPKTLESQLRALWKKKEPEKQK